MVYDPHLACVVFLGTSKFDPHRVCRLGDTVCLLFPTGSQGTAPLCDTTGQRSNTSFCHSGTHVDVVLARAQRGGLPAEATVRPVKGGRGLFRWRGLGGPMAKIGQSVVRSEGPSVCLRMVREPEGYEPFFGRGLSLPARSFLNRRPRGERPSHGTGLADFGVVLRVACSSRCSIGARGAEVGSRPASAAESRLITFRCGCAPPFLLCETCALGLTFPAPFHGHTTDLFCRECRPGSPLHPPRPPIPSCLRELSEASGFPGVGCVFVCFRSAKGRRLQATNLYFICI